MSPHPPRSHGQMQPRRHGTVRASVCLLLASLLLMGALRPAQAVALGASGRPIIQMGLLQYFNPAGRAFNYSGYELDAMEVLAATQLAVDNINSGRTRSLSGESILSAYELQLDVRNSLYSSMQSVALTSDMLDSKNNPHPPPILLGLVGYDEAHAAALASQPFQTPLLTSTASAFTLSPAFPNFNRYCPTDQLEAFALLAMFNVLKWRRVGAIFNTEGGSAQLVQVMTQYGPGFVPGFRLETQSYSYGLVESADFPDVREQLQALKDSGVRIILLSAFASDVLRVLSAAAELGMVGPPYAWVGSSQICVDSTLWSDPRTSHLMDGFICGQSSVNESTIFSQQFQRSWAEAYERDPASVYHIRTPSLSANAYDSVFGAARAMQTVLDLRAACNLSDTGGLGTDMPLSGLVPPIMSEFRPDLYSGGATSGGQNVSFTHTTVPTAFPDVCPWLLYQVGQGRVLNKVLRTQLSVGATGLIFLVESGDRLGDVSFHNIHGGQKRRVATVSGMLIFSMLLQGDLGDSLRQLAAIDASALMAATAAGKAAGARILGNSSWLAGYNASFRPHGEHLLLSQRLTLQPGRALDRAVFVQGHLGAIRFADGTTTIPLDAPLRVELVEPISRNAWIAVLSLTGIVAFYNLALLAFQLWYRKHKLIKITAPKMNVVFLTGSMGILVYIVLLGLDSTQLGGVGRYVELCHAKFAVLAISFSLAFGSLFAKTYRLDAIFNSKHLHVHVVKDRDILLMVLRLIVLDILILVIWGAESPFYRSLSQDDPVLNPLNFNELQVPTRESCGSDNFTTYVIAFLVYKGALLMFGLYLALRVRKIKIATLNDSKWIVMSIYNVTMISVLLIPVSIVVSNNPDVFYLLVSLALLYLVASVLSLLYLPRVLTLCFDVDMFGEGAGVTAGSFLTGGADSRGTASGSDAMRAEMAKLRLRLTQANSDLNEARKQMHAAGLTLLLESRGTSAGVGVGNNARPSQVSPLAEGSHHGTDGPPSQVRSPGGGGGRSAAYARTPTHSQAPHGHTDQPSRGQLASPSLTGGRALPQPLVRIHVHAGSANGGGVGGGSGQAGTVARPASAAVHPASSAPPARHTAAPATEGEEQTIGGATAASAAGSSDELESTAMRAVLSDLPGTANSHLLTDDEPDDTLRIHRRGAPSMAPPASPLPLTNSDSDISSELEASNADAVSEPCPPTPEQARAAAAHSSSL